MKCPEFLDMKCPHCREPVGLFGRRLQKVRRIGRRRTCPDCGGPIVMSYDWEVLIVLAVLGFAVAIAGVYLWLHTGHAIYRYAGFVFPALLPFLALKPRAAEPNRTSAA